MKKTNGDLLIEGVLELERINRYNEKIEKETKVFNLQFGTAGYSQWSYYLAISDIDNGYINDNY